MRRHEDPTTPTTSKPGGVGHLTPGSSVSHTKAQEPNVDLELDVKVFINSGKCVLHTKAKGDDDDPSQRRKRSERSGSGYDSLLHINSPMVSRKARHNLSTSRIKSPFGVPGSLHADVTTFHIPGLDVKIHYDSHTEYEERDSASAPLSFNLPPGSGGGVAGSSGASARPMYTHERSDSGSSTGGSTGQGLIFSSSRRSGTKKASLFAWITLHSVPEETIISPHILDFLEQTLEPIPIPVVQGNTSAAKAAVDGNTDVRGVDEEDAAASTYYASFPVDVIVYFHMQPSTFRFSCQPVSRVECMLRLPALDIVFSSKRAEEEYEHAGEPVSTPKTKLAHHHHQVHHHHTPFASSSAASFRSKLKAPPTDLGPPSLEKGSRDSTSSTVTLVPSSSIIGGLSVTGCLSDFLLYIFHPYGAAKKAGR